MKIAIDASAFFTGPAGARTYLLELLPELIRLLADDDHLLVLYPRSRSLPEQLVWLLRGPQLHTVPMRMPSGGLNRVWRRFGIPAVERFAGGQVRAGDLTVCHSIAPPLLPSAAGRRALTVHSLDADGTGPGNDAAGFVPTSIRRADLVLTPSQRTERAIRSLPGCAEAHVEVVPSGVNERFLRPPKVSDVEALCDTYPFLQEPYFLALGTATEPARNLPFLLDSYALARTREPELPPLVVVSSSDSAEEEIRRRELGGTVLRLEELDGESLPALYRGAELLLYPAFDNAFGQGLLEAAACGVAAIAAPSCGALELLPRGIVSPQQTPAAWAAEIVAMHRDPDRRRHGGQQAQEAARPFTWEAAARRLWDLYSRLAGGRRRRRAEETPE